VNFVVEDDYLVAIALAEMLKAVGANVIGLLSEMQETLSFVEKGNDVDAAILDVDLHGQKSYPVAQALAARRIRFVFATGYGDEALDPPGARTRASRSLSTSMPS
jgi:two-component SAPR family response regulator